MAEKSCYNCRHFEYEWSASIIKCRAKCGGICHETMANNCKNYKAKVELSCYNCIHFYDDSWDGTGKCDAARGGICHEYYANGCKCYNEGDNGN